MFGTQEPELHRLGRAPHDHPDGSGARRRRSITSICWHVGRRGLPYRAVHYPLRHGGAVQYRHRVFPQCRPICRRSIAPVTPRNWRQDLRARASGHEVADRDRPISTGAAAVADRNPIRHWYKGPCLLCGRCRTPDVAATAAQGACMAIEDGILFAELGLERRCQAAPTGPRLHDTMRGSRTCEQRASSSSRVISWRDSFILKAKRCASRVHRRYRAMSRDEVWNALAWRCTTATKVPALKPAHRNAWAAG